MVKIGSDGGSAIEPERSRGLSGFKLRDPFADITKPLDRSAGAPGVSFFTAVRALAGGLSVDWFSQYESVGLGEYMDQAAQEDSFAGLARDLISKHHPGWMGDPVYPQILAGASGLGEFVPISQSPLGKKILEFMAGRGVSGMAVPAFAIGGKIGTLGSEDAMTWMGPWVTEFGTRVFVRLEIRRDTRGVEWCYVHTNLAVATRMPLGLGHGMSKYVAVARGIIQQLFVAESPFPSSMASMSRSMAYPDVPSGAFPLPLASVDDFNIATYVIGDSETPGNISTDTNSFPKVLRAGFAVSAESEKYFDVILPHIVDACARLATITEDGFRNYRDPGAEASFDYFYGSEYVYFDNDGFYPGITASEGVRAGGYSRWIPETMLGGLINATNDAWLAYHQGGKSRDILEWIFSEGAGQSVPAAINTLAFSHLMPEGDLGAAATILGVAIDMDIVNESTNALANLGQVKFAQGHIDEAKEKLRMALDRSDKFAEAEACFHLGTIFAGEGDSVSARQYWERGARAREIGPDQEEFAQKCQDML
jgi:hypothetical protein